MWLKDPKSKEVSVSLTILTTTFILLSLFGMLQALGYINSIGPFNEMFWGAAALYFGRRNISVGGKSFSGGDNATMGQ